MKQINGVIGALSDKNYGIRIESEWYNLPKEPEILERFRKGEKVSLWADEKKNIIFCIKGYREFDEKIFRQMCLKIAGNVCKTDDITKIFDFAEKLYEEGKKRGY